MAALIIILILVSLIAMGFGWAYYKLDHDPIEGEYIVVEKKGRFYVKQKYWSGRYHYVFECIDEMYPPYPFDKVSFQTKEEAEQWIEDKDRE